METLAKALSEYITEGTNLDYEIVKYGVDAILSTFLCFSVALITCTLLNNILFGILFILILTPIKMQFLGFHCKTMHRCIMTYSCCIAASLLFYNFLSNSNFHVSFLIYFILLSSFCVIVHKEINKKNLKIVLLYLIINIFLHIVFYDVFLVSITTLIIEILLVLPVHLKKVPKVAKS